MMHHLTPNQAVQFEKDVLPYIDHLFPAALQMTRNRADAEDLVQETLAQAYDKFQQFTPGHDVRAWLRVIMTNEFISAYRKRSLHPVYPHPRTTVGELATPSKSAESAALDQLANRPAIMRALRALPEVYRTAIYLVDVQGHPHQEVAEMTGVSVGTVKSRVHRARLRLRVRLANYPRAAA